jgi:hypothetical protein
MFQEVYEQAWDYSQNLLQPITTNTKLLCIYKLSYVNILLAANNLNKTSPAEK